MARGNDSQDIVTHPAEWSELKGVITRVKRTSDFRLYAYCLMSNHFHLLLKVGDDPLSRVMHRIQTTWSKRFNARRGRKGHVFEDRFKSLPCDDDVYLKSLLRYIHLNPVRAGLANRSEDWPWSSYREYMDPGSAALCDPAWPLSLFGSDRRGSIDSFRDFVLLGLGEEPETPLLIDSKAPRLSVQEVALPRPPRPDLRQIVTEAAQSRGMDPEAIIQSRRDKEVCAARRIAVSRAVASGYRNIEVARILGISTTAVSKMLRDAN